MIIELPKKERLDNYIKDGLAIVDFIMDDCSYCVKQGKVLDILDYEIPVLKIIRVHKDLNKEEVSSMDIKAFPTIYFYKYGQKVDEMIGFNPVEEFYPVLRKYLYL